MKTIKAEVTWKYYKNGQLRYEGYWIGSKYHNPNGPAWRSWYENGQLKYEAYWIDGKRHNPNGPAWKVWNDNGKLRYEECWIDDKKLTKEQFDNQNQFSLYPRRE